MAGASREGFNLFRKQQRKNFFRGGLFGTKWSRQYVLQDTFGRYVCRLLGHSKKTYDTTDNKGNPSKIYEGFECNAGYICYVRTEQCINKDIEWCRPVKLKVVEG